MSAVYGGDLPEGWVRAELGSLVEPRTGKFDPQATPDAKFIGMEQVEPHTMRLLGTVQCGTMKSGANSFQASDVLYGRMRAYLNKVYQPDFNGLCSGEFIVLPETYAILGRFLKYRLNSGDFVRFANHLNSGDRPRVDFDQIKVFNLLVPPKAEQVRIADKLDELLSDLDAGVAALERAQAKLRQYRAAVLKAAVEGALTAEWRTQHSATEPASALLTRILAERRRRWEDAQLQKYKDTGKALPKNWKDKYLEPVAPDTANLPELAEGWCWVSLDEVAGDSSIGLDRGLQYQRTTPSGSPYIKMNNVTIDGRVLLNDLVFVETSEAERERYSLLAGDLLFNTRNSAELVGKVGIILQAPWHSVYNNNLMRIRLDGAALPAFLCFQMCSGGFRSRMGKVKKATTSVAAVYSKDLFSLPLALPPLAEQTAIVEAVEAQFSVIEHLEADLDAKLKSAQALRQSILRHAFSGQLVPQDPKDEPATELLKRIAAERAIRYHQNQSARKTRTQSPTQRATKRPRKNPNP